MPSTKSGYPLGALFVLVAACAVLAAGVTPVIRLVLDGEQKLGEFFTNFGGGAGCGLFVGLVVGLMQYRRVLGAALGVLVGTVIGAAGGVMALLPSSGVTAAAAAMTAGSALIVGVSLAMRRSEE